MRQSVDFIMLGLQKNLDELGPDPVAIVGHQGPLHQPVAGRLQPRLQGIAAAVIGERARVRHREQGDGEAQCGAIERRSMLASHRARRWLALHPCLRPPAARSGSCCSPGCASRRAGQSGAGQPPPLACSPPASSGRACSCRAHWMHG